MTQSVLIPVSISYDTWDKIMKSARRKGIDVNIEADFLINQGLKK